MNMKTILMLLDTNPIYKRLCDITNVFHIFSIIDLAHVNCQQKAKQTILINKLFNGFKN